MRGEQRGSEGLFSYIRLEERVARDHPLRAILVLVNEVLAALSDRFDELYSHTGRPSIPPEYLLRATLLQAFFTVPSFEPVVRGLKGCTLTALRLPPNRSSFAGAREPTVETG